MNQFIILQSFDALTNAPDVTASFCRKWQELSDIPIRLRSSLVLDWVTSPECLGLVIPVAKEAVANQIPALTCPVINYSNRLEPLQSAINVHYDNAEIGEIAAEHLCEQGFQHFAFLESAGAEFSRRRREAFRSALEKRGYRLDAVFHFEPPPLSPSEYQIAVIRAVADWLANLPKALGIPAANDAVARTYYHALRNLNTDHAVLQALVGVDDDYPAWVKFNMGINAPPLTSIRLNYSALGETCAQLLHAAQTGQGYTPGSIHCVGGAQLIRRESSGGFSCDDPLTAQLARSVAAAVERGEAPNIKDLYKGFSVSGRILSQRFREHTGKTLRDFVMQLRLQRAARLLRQTESSISEIAQQCGFNKHADLTERFGKYMGCSPTEYRRRCD